MQLKLTIVLLLTTAICIGQQKLTPETLWNLGRVSEPEISTDGKSVLFKNHTFYVYENNSNSDIMMLDLTSGTVSKTAGSDKSESSARWMPGSSKVSYLCSDDKGISQLWISSADGSGKIQVTNSDKDINGYGFSASGNRLWFLQDVKIKKFLASELYPDLPKATGRIYDDLMYRHWTAWDDGNYSHVFVVDFIPDASGGKISGTPKDLMEKDPYDCPLKPNGGEEQIDISPDGKWIAYTSKKQTGKEYATTTNSEIYLYEVETGLTYNLTSGMNGYDVNPRFSPDGKKILWLSMQTPIYEADRNRIMIHDFATKKTTEATLGFDYSVDQAKWSADGNMIYFISDINATDQLWVYDSRLKSLPAVKQITKDIGDHTALTFTTVGKETVMVTAMMSISHPAELFRISMKDGSSSQISFINKNILSNVKMGKVEKRMVKATDGKDILTWVIYPPDFDASKKYPTLLYCQGGPQSTVSQFFSYRWNFQLMAANGYIVVAPNRRGLPGFGSEWNRQISGDWGGQNMKDYLSAIDDVSKETYINKDKIGCVGASYGGYSVYWMAGHHQKRFKAFIAHCGVFNLKSMYGTTEELWFPDFDLGGPYWKNPNNISYQKFSPNDYIQNWDTPILVIHNEKDFRVPLGQGMEAYTAARVQNIPARFLYFPDEGHWVTKPQNSILWQRVFFDWLDKYLK